MHFLDFFPSKLPEKRPHMTNLATFVQNRSNLACTPQMSTPSAPQNLSLFRVDRKIDFSKTGLQTSPEGSVSEHLHVLTIKTTPHVFYTLTPSKQKHMHNYIQFL